jgi:putative ABC transport system permease protein
MHAATPYDLIGGRPPADRGEIVVTSGAIAARSPTAEIGTAVELVTPAGASSYTVVGLVAPGDGRRREEPVFLHDGEAAELAPAVDAFAVWPASAAAAVEDLVTGSYPGVAVLSGEQRAGIDQDPQALAAVGAVILLSFMLATVAFVVVYSVATTFSMSVALRRRELGLLRATGATPRQVRRLVLREALVLTTAAAGLGGVASLAVGPALGTWLVRNQLVPSLHVAPRLEAIAIAVAGVQLAAIAGAWVAARRASRVRPAEALSEAVVDRNVMSPLRWLVAVPSLAGAAALASAGVSNDLEAQLALAMGQALLAITGLAMISPVIVPRLVVLASWPLSGAGRGMALLVGRHARAGVRRTTAMASPALVAVGLALSLIAVVRTIEASEQAARQEALAPGALVATAGSGALSAADVEALAAVPGARVGAVLEARGHLVAVGLREVQIGEVQIAGIDRSTVELAARWEVIDGDLGQLVGSAVALGELVALNLSAGVGDQVGVVLPDGTRQDLPVVAVVANGLDSNGLFVPRSLLAGHAGPRVATEIFVAADGEAAAAISAVAASRGLDVSDNATRRLLDVTDSSHLNRLALIAILGVAVAYVGLAIVASAAVLTVSRAGELASIRLAGATRRDTVVLAGAETLAAFATGALLGVGAAAVPILGVARSLGSLTGPTSMSVPWMLTAGLVLAGATLAVTSSTLVAWRSQQRPPHEATVGRLT